MNVYDRMKEKGIVLPPAPARGGLYSPCKMVDGWAYLSGCGCNIGDKVYKGTLGKEFTVEEGRQLARNCALNLLSVLEREIGDLNRVKACAKILVLVASQNDFFRQPEVANGASGLLAEVFGEDIGLPARSAIGVNVLPGNLPVEVEAVFALA